MSMAQESSSDREVEKLFRGFGFLDNSIAVDMSEIIKKYVSIAPSAVSVLNQQGASHSGWHPCGQSQGHTQRPHRTFSALGDLRKGLEPIRPVQQWPQEL